MDTILDMGKPLGACAAFHSILAVALGFIASASCPAAVRYRRASLVGEHALQLTKLLDRWTSQLKNWSHTDKHKLPGPDDSCSGGWRNLSPPHSCRATALVNAETPFAFPTHSRGEGYSPSAVSSLPFADMSSSQQVRVIVNVNVLMVDAWVVRRRSLKPSRNCRLQAPLYRGKVCCASDGGQRSGLIRRTGPMRSRQRSD